MSTVRRSAIARRRVDGVLLLDKPGGMSSNAALQCARRLFAAAKAGHTGTLDPLASGLLPICLGEATKFAGALLEARKTYLASVRFGIVTRTGDAEGEVLSRTEPAFSREDLLRVLAGFVGELQQVPPMHSALKRDGRAYYQYARAGVDIERSPRAIVVESLVLEDWQPPRATLAITCGKGTYVRVLAEDIGKTLGCGAHLAGLRRTASGGFSLSAAISLDALEAMDAASRDACLLPPDALLAALPRVDLDTVSAARLRHGQGVPRPEGDGRYRAYASDALVGLVCIDGGVATAQRLLAH